MKRSALLVAAMILFARPAAADEPLGKDNLLAALRAADEWTAPDQFTARPGDDALIGRRVRIVLPIAAPSQNRSPVWTYDPQRQQMSILGLGEMWPVFQALWAPGMNSGSVGLGQGVALWESKIDRPTETRTNGLVTINVERSRWRGLGISAVGGGSPIETLIYRPSFALSAERARAASANMRWVGEGEVVAIAPGRAIACADNVRTPTVQSPVEQFRHFCTVAVRFDRVAVEADGGSTVLDEWVRATGYQHVAVAPSGDGTATIGTSVQIGAFSSEQIAVRELATTTSTFPAYTVGKSTSVIPVRSSNGTTVYRTMYTGLTPAEATTLCVAMRGIGRDCLVR